MPARSLSLLLIAVAASTFYFWRGVTLPYQGFQGEQFVTIEPGSSVTAMGAALAGAGVVRDARSFQIAARNASLIAALDPVADDLEGYLFPSTYRLPRDASARALVALMVQSFEKAFDAELRSAAAARGFSVREAVTMASLVEEEAQKPEERPMIAAVYHNRLKIGMGMQADPTVIYALQKAGRYDGNIRREDLDFDSPYNTYKYAGLPPGPIASPRRASIETQKAVL